MWLLRSAFTSSVYVPKSLLDHKLRATWRGRVVSYDAVVALHQKWDHQSLMDRHSWASNRLLIAILLFKPKVVISSPLYPVGYFHQSCLTLTFSGSTHGNLAGCRVVLGKLRPNNSLIEEIVCQDIREQSNPPHVPTSRPN